MKVLKNWYEVGKSVNVLKEAGLPLHTDPVKNWDFNNIREMFSARVNKGSHIADLGCGPSLNGCMTLNLLASMGYDNLTGIDLYIPIYTRLAAIMQGWKKFNVFRPPYRMISADITSTGLGEDTVDAVVLLSVVEHGVNLEKLFFELNRILKTNGVVYLSTDYWKEVVSDSVITVASGAYQNDPLPWSIFDNNSILNLLSIGEKNGFRVCDGKLFPPCEDRPVFWQKNYYTLISIEFEKIGPSHTF